MAEGLEVGTAYLQLVASEQGLQRDVDRKVKAVTAPDIVAKIDANIAKLEKSTDQARKRLEGLRAIQADPQIDLDITALRAKAALAEKQIKDLRGQEATAKVTADIASLEAQVGRANQQITRLEARRSGPKITADISDLETKIRAAESRISRLQAARATAKVNVDGAARAVAELDGVDRARKRVDGSRASLSIAASGGAQASGMLGAVVAGLAAVISLAPAAGAALGTALAAGSGGAQALGAITAGFSGVGDAIKSVQADEKSAATSSAGAASSRVSSARQIEGAQSSLAAAVIQADRASITGGQQVAAARRAVSDAVVSSAERTQDAERAVGRAQQSAQYAQESLTRARRDAVEANRDLQLSLSGAAIAEKRAALALQKAQDARASGGEVDPAKYKGQELDLDVAEADQQLKEVRKRYGDLQGEQAKWARGGVDNSDQVVAAQRAVADANAGVEDSQRSLTRTQRDGARQVQDAVAQVAQAQQAAAWAQQDAARSVGDAQRGLQAALDQTAASAGAAGSAGKKSAYDLAQLSPAGRDFVSFWTGQWKPAMDDVSHSVADQMLPRVQRSMLELLGLQPELKAGLSQTGAEIGDLAVRGADLATSPAFRRDFVSIMGSNNRALNSWGQAALYGVDGARALTVAGLPLSEQLARVAANTMQSVDSFLLEKESTGELAQFMQLGADKAGQLVRVAVDLAGTAFHVAEAMAPVGAVIVDVVDGTVRLVGEFADAHQGLTAFIVTAGLGLAATNALAKGVVALQVSYGIASGGLKTLGSLAGTTFNPAALAQTRILSGVRDTLVNSAPAVSTYAAGLTGSVKAGNAAGSATAWFGRAATGTAAALPALALGVTALVVATAALTISNSEASDALQRGGAAAEQTRQKIAAQNGAVGEGASGIDRINQSVNEWIGSTTGLWATQQTATDELNRSRAAMSDLQRAQSYATEAQGNYEAAVRQFGPTSAQAVSAMADLKNRTRDVEIAQTAVREKTDLATAALLYQRDQILAGLDADLRLRMSKQQLAKDQQGLADAIKNSGATSQEAVTAGQQLEQTQLRTAEAAKSGADGQRAYAQAVGDMVSKTSGQLTPSLAGMVQSLDGAGLAAAGAKVHIDDAGHAVAVFPNGKTVTLDANTSPALTGLAGVQYELGLVPPGKAITVTTLDAEAQQHLRDLGFTVTTLPNGQVQVTANDAQARGTLMAFQQFAAWQVANPQLAADPARANQAMRDFLVNAGQQTGVPMLDANPARADQQVTDAVNRYNTTWSHVPVAANTDQADKDVHSWWDGVLAWIGQGIPFPWNWGKAGGGSIPGRASGGPIQDRISHKQVIGRLPGHAGGLLVGPGTGTSDSIVGLDAGGMPTARVSNGEYVVRKRAVDAVGIPALDAINSLRGGGLVGLAAGGQAQQPPGAAGGTSGAGAAVGSTSALAGAMGVAAGAAGTLLPELAAVTAQQQAMVSSGIAPLSGALSGVLAPALAASSYQVGTVAPTAYAALQLAQAGTQVSTALTAQDTELASLAMSAAVTGMSLQAQAQHAGLRAGQLATQVQTDVLAAETALASGSMAASTTGMSLVSQAQHSGLRISQGQTVLASQLLAANVAGSNAYMQATTGAMSAVNQGHLEGLRISQGVTAGSTAAFADAWRAQLGRTVPDSADPIRWIINFPMRSIVDAWNNLDGQFALGKHVNPAVANFATGGRIAGPGTGTSDDVPIMASDGEFMVREKIASRVPHFLAALNSGQAEALQAAGGRGARMPGFAQGGLISAQMFAARESGKPYIWGGVGPAGYDCSGFMSAIANVAFGRNPYQRLGVAAGVPWPGQAPGLGGALSQGASRQHTAGTVGGINAEAGGGHGDVRFGGPAVGADSPQFPVKAFWPQLGGRFTSGGAGDGSGGAAFDPTPMINDAFAKAYQEIADVPRFFGGSDQVARGQGVARVGADSVKAKAVEAAMAMFASSGLWGPPGAGAPFIVKQISDAARAFRVGVDGATIGVATGLVESNLTNLAGGDRDSVGVFQQRPSMGWGSVAECMNVLHAAGSFFSRFPANWRAMAPGDVAQSVQRSAFPAKYAGRIGQARGLVAQYGGAFDNGGLLPPGRSVVENRTRIPERVLDNVETKSYDTLTRLVGRGGAQIDLGDFEGGGETHNHFFEGSTFHEEVDIDQAMRRAEFLVGTASL